MNEGMRQVVRSEVGEQVGRLESRVASIESTLSAQVSMHDVVQQQLTDISKDLCDLKDMKLADRVSKLELDIASLSNHPLVSVTPSPSGFQCEGIMSEMRERQRRANNLIFYNVPESTAGSMTAPIENEIAYLKEALNKLNIDFQDNVLKTSRIGKPDQTRTRPLVVTMRDSSIVSRVLSSNC